MIVASLPLGSKTSILSQSSTSTSCIFPSSMSRSDQKFCMTLSRSGRSRFHFSKAAMFLGLSTEFEDNTSGLGRLRAAVKSPKPNTLEHDVLVLLNLPVHHYVTPKFYKQMKPDTGKVVPTWDYEAVEVHGKASVYFDTKSDEFESFLATQIADLSEHMETSIMGYGKPSETRPSKVEDAPKRYIELLTKNIIGIEIEVTWISGRFKWSQEKPAGDRVGVTEGFKDLNTPGSTLLSEQVIGRAALFDANKAAKKPEI
ncbi:putative FMN-binding domain-containing protein [Halenospora varia]|nr:putative FMN-binding domain-containing protein [Halenospora varia]